MENIYTLPEALYLLCLILISICAIAIYKIKNLNKVINNSNLLLEVLRPAYVLFDKDEQIIDMSPAVRKLFIHPNQSMDKQPKIELMSLSVWQEFLYLKATECEKILSEDMVYNKDCMHTGHAYEIIMDPDENAYMSQFQTLPNKNILLSFRKVPDRKIYQAPIEPDRIMSLAKLAGGMAHDFNNILAIIDGYARMISKPGQTIDDIRPYIEKISLAAKRGGQLTHKMMIFGKHQIETNMVVNVADILDKNQFYLTKDIPRNITPIIQIKTYKSCVRCLDDSLITIMRALIQNAAEAMPNGGTLNISANITPTPPMLDTVIQSKNAIHISVIDTGQGIKKRDIAKIYEPFFTTKTNASQSGLGLSLAYGLVQKMGGHIHTQSTYGRGTHIDLYFPEAAQTQSRQILGDIQKPEYIKMPGYTALVVDDEPDLLDVVADMLSDMEMNVIKAKSGDEALLLQDEFNDKIDILLTDIAMPGMDGVKLAQMISAFDQGIKVLYMSGFPGRGTLEYQGMPSNAQYICKPMNYDDLAMCLYNQLSGDGDKQYQPSNHWVESDAGHA